MSGATRRGGIPGPESRTGLVRPAMTEAEFERRVRPADEPAEAPDDAGSANPAAGEPEAGGRTPGRGRGGAKARAVAVRPRRIQRMFALEEDLDKKLRLYAIHIGKGRSEVINDLLRPLVASMVLYDSRDRRNGNGRSLEAVDD